MLTLSAQIYRRPGLHHRQCRLCTSLGTNTELLRAGGFWVLLEAGRLTHKHFCGIWDGEYAAGGAQESCTTDGSRPHRCSAHPKDLLCCMRAGALTPTLAQGESELEVVPAWQGGGEMGWVQWEGRPAG